MCLFQECSKKQKNDDKQNTQVDVLNSNDENEEVILLFCLSIHVDFDLLKVSCMQ